MREYGRRRIPLCMKNKIAAILYNRKANDEEEVRKCVLGFCYERYDDTIKKQKLIRLYRGKQFHHGLIKKP